MQWILPFNYIQLLRNRHPQEQNRCIFKVSLRQRYTLNGYCSIWHRVPTDVCEMHHGIAKCYQPTRFPRKPQRWTHLWQSMCRVRQVYILSMGWKSVEWEGGNGWQSGLNIARQKGSKLPLFQFDTFYPWMWPQHIHIRCRQRIAASD